jgi:2-keto-4-pentenoate hydratase/2-oxohepta-3-ene-1,7-dioic acid hydratase in catechol pathway
LCVWLHHIRNDVSVREWQRSDRTFWRGKNADTFKPIGPWIERDVRLADMATTVRLNGDAVNTFGTNDMVFGVATTISEITRYIKLVPGDVIWMGTDDPTLDMVPGDTVEVEIDGIGVLRNPVR